jgi:hypothetical protein
MDDFDESPPASPQKLSKAPSWVMVGFVLGAAFVAALNSRPRRETAANVSPPAPPPKAAPATVTPPGLSDVEAYFAKWGDHAVWANDTTYIVAWDIASATYRDAFEVLRVGEKLYFRSVPRPRGMRVREGVPQNSPLQFLIPIPETRAGIFGLPPGTVMTSGAPWETEIHP